ncbi:uncharacterized protein LOC113759590 [Coffea eugenioides]|uniref:uncharacterized protein LOC113759590 n=1 Tax=Coffea eugenioides TaxID=49369 RepID=UPI000F60AEBA|nr:uncharacterized protein LOC113759590 [Coffea eugenioides]
MTHKAGIEGVEKLFRDLMDNFDLLDQGCKRYKRAKLDPNFTEYLLRIGNGTKPVIKDENVEIPSKMLIRYSTEEESLAALINIVYLDFSIFASSNYSGINRSILTTENDFVDEINDSLIQKFLGDSFDYISHDTCLDPSQQAILEDFINSLAPNGLPPHHLTLKQNTPIMLLQNIDPPKGLCNGTGLVCRSLKSNVIDAVISSGEFSGKQVFLHRICFRVEDDPTCPISFERIQFLVQLCFAMTINKTQGQTLDFVGIYLPEPIFSHGQLYVDISRAKSSNSVKALIRPLIHNITLDNLTPNIVYQEVLHLANA